MREKRSERTALLMSEDSTMDAGHCCMKRIDSQPGSGSIGVTPH